MDDKTKIEFTDTQEAVFDQAFELLGDGVDLGETDEFHSMRGNAVYTAIVILWMLVYQSHNPWLRHGTSAVFGIAIGKKPCSLPRLGYSMWLHCRPSALNTFLMIGN